jgi:hypothetical protein
MKKISLLLLILPFICTTSKLFSQTILLTQSFDTIPQGSVPFGWSSIKAANPASLGWGVDSTNKSTGYAGASGLRNMVIKNLGNSTGIYKLITKSISTSGYRNIAISFASRVSNNFLASGSTTPNLFYSINNGATWIAVPYTDNPANSTYALVNGGTPIALPNAANNQTSLQLKWEIQIDSAASGTYRIDDLNLTGLTCNTSTSITNDTICAGTNYVFAGNTYTSTGN